MASVTEHYETYLAPIYVWMAGGIDADLARGAVEIEALCLGAAQGRLAVDLGAGFGMHAIPLARRGYSVVAIDSSAHLLATLRAHAVGLPLRVVNGDLLAFLKYLDTKPDTILCLGDTLTHLPDHESVERLLSLAAGALVAGGRFVATFRDYTAALEGNARFIPVRSDVDRILTCFLDYSANRVTVHDVLHERVGGTWRMGVSSYRKLRLSPEEVSRSLQTKGFTVRVEPGLAGMTRVVATRA